MVAMLLAFPALETARCSSFSMKAQRFVEAYRNAPEIGVIGKVALSLSESSSAERDRDNGKI